MITDNLSPPFQVIFKLLAFQSLEFFPMTHPLFPSTKIAMIPTMIATFGTLKKQ
jgi:hypothetical protein